MHLHQVQWLCGLLLKKIINNRSTHPSPGGTYAILHKTCFFETGDKFLGRDISFTAKLLALGEENGNANHKNNRWEADVIKWKHGQIIKPFKLLMQIKSGNKITSEITRTGCLRKKKRLTLLFVSAIGGGGVQVQSPGGEIGISAAGKLGLWHLHLLLRSIFAVEV